VVFDLCHDLCIGQSGACLDADDSRRRGGGSHHAITELELGLARSKYQQGLGSAHFVHDMVEELVHTPPLAFLIFFSPPPF
jgi:hypothetical protein